MCKPLLPEQPPLPRGDYLDQMIEAVRNEDGKWSLYALGHNCWKVVRDGVPLKTLFEDLGNPQLKYDEFNNMRHRAAMEAAYKAAQAWFFESVNRGNPVPNDVLWPRFGVASVPANMVWGDGFAIHHKDGDVRNNDLTNMMPLPYAWPTLACGMETVGDGVALMSVSHPEPCGLFPEKEESERDRIARVTREMCGG